MWQDANPSLALSKWIWHAEDIIPWIRSKSGNRRSARGISLTSVPLIPAHVISNISGWPAWPKVVAIAQGGPSALYSRMRASYRLISIMWTYPPIEHLAMSLSGLPQMGADLCSPERRSSSLSINPCWSWSKLCVGVRRMGCSSHSRLLGKKSCCEYCSYLLA